MGTRTMTSRGGVMTERESTEGWGCTEAPATALPLPGGDAVAGTPEGAPISAAPWDGIADETGAATAEYAIATLAACGFAALLVALLKSGEVRTLLMGIITAALSMGG